MLFIIVTINVYSIDEM